MQSRLNAFLEFFKIIFEKMNVFKRKYCLLEKVEHLCLVDEDLQKETNEDDKFLSMNELKIIDEEKSKINEKETNKDVARRIFRVFIRWSCSIEDAKSLVIDSMNEEEFASLDVLEIESYSKLIMDSFYYHKMKSKNKTNTHPRKKRKWMICKQ
tara:strand:- start:474 stop:935 length:462 start_codon:yes stop_codon:yes gene_type:complete